MDKMLDFITKDKAQILIYTNTTRLLIPVNKETNDEINMETNPKG